VSARLALAFAFAAGWAALCGARDPASAAEAPNADTLRAFERYIGVTETRVDERARGLRPYLWIDEQDDRRKRVRAGETLVERSGIDQPTDIPGGLVHDWIGAVFIPKTTLNRTLALLQDYDHHKLVYQPEVIDSKLVARDGDRFTAYLRLRKKKLITVVLDTEHEVQYVRLDRARSYSISRSTRIAEVENAGTPDERTLPAGADHGYLWRLNSYWRLEEADGGVLVECQAVSLTRGIPAGLGWLVGPIVTGLPRESLARTLAATLEALQGLRGHDSRDDQLTRPRRGGFSAAMLARHYLRLALPSGWRMCCTL
jgi:hypothetical protein